MITTRNVYNVLLDLYLLTRFIKANKDDKEATDAAKRILCNYIDDLEIYDPSFRFLDAAGKPLGVISTDIKKGEIIQPYMPVRGETNTGQHTFFKAKLSDQVKHAFVDPDKTFVMLYRQLGYAVAINDWHQSRWRGKPPSPLVKEEDAAIDANPAPKFTEYTHDLLQKAQLYHLAGEAGLKHLAVFDAKIQSKLMSVDEGMVVRWRAFYTLIAITLFAAATFVLVTGVTGDFDMPWYWENDVSGPDDLPDFQQTSGSEMASYFTAALLAIAGAITVLLGSFRDYNGRALNASSTFVRVDCPNIETNSKEDKRHRSDVQAFPTQRPVTVRELFLVKYEQGFRGSVKDDFSFSPLKHETLYNQPDSSPVVVAQKLVKSSSS